MKKTIKILIIAIFIFSIYIASRFVFSYTIFNRSLMFGIHTYMGGENDFPYCILNTRKIESIKIHIAHHWEEIAKTDKTDSEAIYRFFASDFDIISVVVLKKDIITGKPAVRFLLQQTENSKNKCCIVDIDKKTKQLLRIMFSQYT